MAITELYSRRQKRIRGEFPDVYQYDTLPEGCKNQCVHIFNDVINLLSDYSEIFCSKIFFTLCREHGTLELSPTITLYRERLYQYMLNGKELEKNLDIIELVLSNFPEFIQPTLNCTSKNLLQAMKAYDALVAELNIRFKENGVGYQFNIDANQIIRIDSEFTHSEIIVPALKFLNCQGYEAANDEFLSAHEHYRHGNYEECIAECLKAFESIMKIICNRRGWAFDAEKDTASKLVAICKNEGLFPDFHESHLNSVVCSLKDGLPTLRNKKAGHGAGTEQRNVPDSYARYALHLAATNILFLADCDKELG